MEPAEARRAVAAARSTAAAQGLVVDDAAVLSDSNRLVVRLTPCGVVARVAVAPPEYRLRLDREVDVVRRLAACGSPVAGLDPRVEPRVFDGDGFAISMWSHVAPVRRARPPAEYARALERLHADLRTIDVAAPHVMDRVAATQHDVANRDVTPDLTDADRALLADALRDLRASILERRPAEQLLHGEPHPWNVLDAADGPLLTDFEDVARGPVEYDLAWVPEEVSERDTAADHDLVDEFRGIVLAIIATHRWTRGDEHPSGRRSGVAFLDALREGPPWPGIDAVSWPTGGS